MKPMHEMITDAFRKEHEAQMVVDEYAACIAKVLQLTGVVNSTFRFVKHGWCTSDRTAGYLRLEKGDMHVDVEIPNANHPQHTGRENRLAGHVEGAFQMAVLSLRRQSEEAIRKSEARRHSDTRGLILSAVEAQRKVTVAAVNESFEE